MRTRIQLRVRWLPYLVCAVLIMQLMDSSRVWMVFLVILGGMWLIGYFWVREIATHLTLRREMRYGWAQVGDILEERFTLTNSSILPILWVRVHDQSQVPGYQASRIAHVESQKHQQWKHTGRCAHRGLFTLGPTLLTSADPFGIFEVSLLHTATATLLVVPPIIPLPAIEVAPGGRTGNARPRANVLERTVSVSGIREYVPGDSLRDIHWHSTARMGEPYVRRFDGTPAGDWHIIIDLQAGAQIGHGWDSTAEHAIVLAASLADQGLRQGKAVGLATNSAPPIWLAPRSGENRRWEILRELAAVELGEHSLTDLFQRQKTAFDRYASLIIITSNSNESWLAPLLAIMRRGSVPTILLFDPVSFGAPYHPANLGKLLRRLGLQFHLIPRQYLDRPEAKPGHGGQWEFRVTALGRAVPVRRPESAPWKVLS